MKRVILWTCALVLALLVILPMTANPTNFGAVLKYLTIGWWRFLGRNLSDLTWNWNLIGMVLLCSSIILALGNWVLAAIYRQIRQLRGAQNLVRWRWRWTAGVYFGLWLLFIIAFAATGVFRHTAWLLDEKEPWYSERLNFYSEIRIADGTIQELLLENDSDLDKTRKSLQSQTNWHYRANLFCEKFDVIFYSTSNTNLDAYVLVPREPQLLKRGQFVVSLQGQPYLQKPLSELQSTIAELDAKYPVKP